MEVKQQQLYLSERLRDLLKVEARSQRRSVSSLCEDLLTQGLMDLEKNNNSQMDRLKHLENVARGIK